MKRLIVVTAALLASALSAQAAVKKHTWVVNGRACHETVITGKSNATRYALGIFSGQIPLPQKGCYPRDRDNEGSESDEVNRRLYGY